MARKLLRASADMLELLHHNSSRSLAVTGGCVAENVQIYIIRSQDCMENVWNAFK